MSNKLLLMSGTWHWSGWVSVDANANEHPDIVAIVPPLPAAIKSRRWDQIMIIHGIEHLFYQDALLLTQECLACLAPNGELVLECPNLEYCCRALLGLIKTPPEEWDGQFSTGGIFGDPRPHDRFNMHLWGYTPVTLVALLVRAGFDPALVRVEAAQYHQPVRDFRVVGVKESGI